MEDTIYAPSSAIGGAVAVLRVSGSLSRAIAAAMFSRDVTLHPRTLLFCRAMEGDKVLDDCMAVFLPGKATYTGEDMLEINCHGGYRTVQRLLDRLSKTGARPAEPGEFTKRAFLNGKMDLSEAEAVMDVVTARGEESLKAAMEQLHGALSERIKSVEELLLDSLSSIDAAIDFPEEMEEETLVSLPASLTEASLTVQKLIAEGLKGKVLREGLFVALVGRPNVGKSSLLNALLEEERAIVTAAPGTTRDTLDEETVLEGVPLRLVDTAGIRETAEEAEKIGVARAREALKRADLVLLVLDGTEPLTKLDRELLSLTADKKRILVRSKKDLPQCDEEFGDIALSAKSGEGLPALKKRILFLGAPVGGEVVLTNRRHIEALERAEEALHEALQTSELDCAATDIRRALRFLGSITGSDVDADVIDRIFSRFCVGK